MTRAIVVGAGIGGLATAIALRPGSLDAVVLERAPELSKVELGAGITLWSNAMLVLDRLGVGDEVRARGAVLSCFEQRNRRGRLLSRWPLGEMGRRLGAPVCGINRPDLHAALAAAAGDRVRTGENVEGFQESDRSVSVMLSNRGVHAGEVLIAADGIDSIVRRQLLGARAPRFSGLTMWRANVAIAAVPPPAVDFTAWWGAGAKFVVFRSGPERISWEGIVTNDLGGHDPPGGRRRAVMEHFRDFTDPVAAIIDATDEEAIFRTDVFDRPPEQRWGRGRVTLLGDAAHPMTFAVGQGAAQALEDALALADALHSSPEDLEAALREYEQQRMPRCAHFQTMAWRLARAGALTNPAAQLIRNTAFRASAPLAWRMQVKDMAIPARGQA